MTYIEEKVGEEDKLKKHGERIQEDKKFCSTNEHDAHILASWGGGIFQLPFYTFVFFFKIITFSSASHSL